MPNGNSFSSIARSLNQKSNKAIDGLPDYYPANIPLDFYSPKLAVSSNLQMTAEEREELRQEEEAIERQNSTVNQFTLLPWSHSEQAFELIIQSNETVEEKIKTIQEFIETEIWDNEKEINFTINDQLISGFKISPAFLHQYLNDWQKQIEKNNDVTPQTKEQVQKLCDESCEKLKKHIAKLDIKTLQAIAVDSLYIAARLTDQDMPFSQLRKRLDYYYTNCSSIEFRCLIANLILQLESYSKYQVSHQDVLDGIYNELNVWIVNNTEKSQESSKEQQSSSTFNKAAVLATSVAVLASQIIPAAATEYVVNKNAGNATNPGMAANFPDGFYPVVWVNQNDQSIYTISVSPQNGTTKTTTEFKAGLATPVVNTLPSLPTIQCVPSNGSNSTVVFYGYYDSFFGVNRDFIGRFNETNYISDNQMVISNQLPNNQNGAVFSDAARTVVMTHQDVVASVNQVNLLTIGCNSFGFINRTLVAATGTSPTVAVSTNQSYFWLTWSAISSGLNKIFIQPFNTTLTSLASSISISGATYNTDNSFISPKNATSAVVAYERYNGTNTEVMAAVVNTNGATLTSTTPFSLSSTASSSVNHTQPQMKQLTDGTVMAVFVETNITTGMKRIIGNRLGINADGSATVKNSGNFVINEDANINCSNLAIQLTQAGDGIVVAYQCDHDGVSDVRVKQVPILGFYFSQDKLTISEGQTVLLSTAQLCAKQNGDDLDTTVFTVSGLSSSTTFQVYNGTSWNTATSFSQAQIKANQVQVVHNGSSETPVAYQVSANNGTQTINSTPVITYIPVNDAPNITVSTFGNMINAQTYNLTASNLGIVDPDNTSTQLGITFSNLVNVVFKVFNGISWVVQNTCSYLDVLNNMVSFETADPNSPTSPSCTISVSDGLNTTVANMTPNNFTFIPSPSVTPTATPTRTPTPSVTPTVTPTPSVSPTRTPSVTPSRTPSSSVTPSRTPSSSTTPSRTPSVTSSPTQAPSGKVVKTHTSNTPIIGGVIGGVFGLVTVGLAAFGVFKGISKCNLAKEQSEERLNKSPTGIAAALFDALGLTEHEQFDSFKDACDKFYASFLERVKQDDTLKSYYGVDENSDDVSDRDVLVEQIVNYLTSKENFDTYFETEISCSQGRIRRLVSDDHGNLPFADDKNDIIDAIIDKRPKSTFQIENA